MKCINRSHAEFKLLQKKTNFHPDLLASLVSEYMETNDTDIFPTLSELGISEDVFFEESETNPVAEMLGVENTWETPVNLKRTPTSDETLSIFLDNNALDFNEEELEKYNQVIKVVGETEALRDYLEYEKVIRSPELVLEKVLLLETESFENDLSQQNPFFDNDAADSAYNSENSTALELVGSVNEIVENNNKIIAIEAVIKLSKQLKVPYELMSRSEFETQFPGRGLVAGMFKEGKVYLIQDGLNKDTVFHEFAHAIIKSMSSDNPELFDKLYENLSLTPEGRTIIDSLKEGYAEYNLNGSNFKEEAIVHALTEAFKNNLDSKPGFFKELFFQIKQFLRKVLGKKINISNLSSATTLEELLSMINEGDAFNLNVDFLKGEDVEMFALMYDAQVAELKKISSDKTQAIVNEFYDVVTKMLGELTKENSSLSSLKEELSTDFNDSILQKMKKDLALISQNATNSTVSNLESDRFNTKVVNSSPEAIKDADNSLDLFDRKLRTFAKIMGQADALADHFSSTLAKMSTDDFNNDSEKIEKFYSIHVYVKNYVAFFNVKLADYFTNNNGGLLKEAFDKTNKKLTDLNTVLNNQVGDLVFESLYDHIIELNEPIETETRKELQTLYDKGLFQEYDNLYMDHYGFSLSEENEYNAFLKLNIETIKKNPEDLKRFRELELLMNSGRKITKEQVRLIAANVLSDSKSFMSYFSTAIKNQDLVISGFDSFLKKAFSTIGASQNKMTNEMMHGLQSILKGTKDSRIFGEEAFGRSIASIDTFGEVEKPNEKNTDKNKPVVFTPDVVVAREERVFKSNFKGFRFKLKELDNSISIAAKAFAADKTEPKQVILEDAIAAKYLFEAKYMNRDNIDSYYEADDLFYENNKLTDVGRSAKRKVTSIFEEINLYQNSFNEDPTDFTDAEEMNRLFYEYSQLSNIYDKNGVEKTGEDKEIALLLIKQKELNLNKHTYEYIPNKFELALTEYMTVLSEQFESTDSEEYLMAVDKWIERNTKIQVDPSYYEDRKKLTDERDLLLSNLLEKNIEKLEAENLISLKEGYEYLSANLSPTRNSDGMYDGTMMSKELQEEIKNKDIEIYKSKEKSIGSTGLTEEDNKKLINLENEESIRRLSKDDKDKLALLRLGIISGLNAYLKASEDLNKIKLINSQLQNNSFTSFTPIYKQTFLDILSKSPAAMEILLKNLKESDLNKYKDTVEIHYLSESFLKSILKNKTLVEKLKGESVEFQEWFGLNHFEKSEISRSASGNKRVIDVYSASSAWKFSGPTETNSYIAHSTPITFFSKGFVEDKSKRPRVPNMSYQEKKAIDSMINKEVLRDDISFNSKDEATINALANKDNKGRWLPKTEEQNGGDATYIDKSFMELLENDPAAFRALDYLKNIYLSEQDKLDISQRSYLTYPKERMGGVSRLYKGGPKAVLKRRVSKITRAFGFGFDEIDNLEEGLYAENKSIVSSSISERVTRPIHGLHHLDISETGTNILSLLADWNYSKEEFIRAREVNPFSQLLTETISSLSTDPKIKDFRDKMKDLNIFQKNVTPDLSKRLKFIRGLMDKHISGEQISYENKYFDKKYVTGALRIISTNQGIMATRSFIFNIKKSLTNYNGAKMMIYLKAFDKKLFSRTDLLKTRVLSARLMAMIVAKSYSRAALPALLQLSDVMDAIPDRIKNDRLAGSRSIIQDASISHIGFVDRKFFGNSASVHQFLAILHKNKISVNGKLIPLYDAVTLNDKGSLETVKGVPEDYQIKYIDGVASLGKGIKKLMAIHQDTLLKTIGASNDLHLPEFYRSTIARFTMFLIKFFPNMLTDKIKIGTVTTKGGLRITPRVNPITGRYEIGTYMGSIETILQLIRTRGQYVSPRNYLGALQVVALFLINKIHTAIIGSMKIYANVDGDDEDEDAYFNFDKDRDGIYNMLRYSTNALKAPSFFEAVDLEIDPTRTSTGGRSFDLENFLKVSFLDLGEMVANEMETFAPYTTEGKVPLLNSTYNMLIGKGVLQSSKPAVMEYIQAGMYLLDDKNPDSFYKQDSGPWSFQNEGSNKAWNIIMKAQFGLDGSFMDPVFGLENRISNKKRQ